MKQKRVPFRLKIHRVGQISRGGDVAWCEITEFTERGIGLRSDLPVAVGEDIEVEFDLTNTWPIHCTIHVTHAEAPRLGGPIMAISDEHMSHIKQFIDQHTAINLTGF